LKNREVLFSEALAKNPWEGDKLTHFSRLIGLVS